jgi:hypothetical protein
LFDTHPSIFVAFFHQLGPGVNFVNHNQTMANVKIQWADPARSNHMPHLLDFSLAYLETDKTAKLAFEMVATKPIKRGEEVFLNYGDAWEEAWQTHLSRWKPVPGSAAYIPAFRLQETETRFKTVFEQVSDPYPPNIKLEVMEQFFHDGWQDAYEDDTPSIDFAGGRRNVDILRVEEDDDGNFWYTVVDHDEDEIYEDLPHEAFRFVDHPHTTDMYLGNAFRHDIRIPDEIFPLAWKNRAKRNTTESPER